KAAMKQWRCVELITVTTPQKYVNVTRGGSVKLQCMFVTIQETNGLNIQWDFVPSSSLTQEQGRIQPPSSPGSTRNASIIISNMQPSDAGVYSCEVHNFPDVDGQSQVNIIVNVLGKPSYPFCAVHGDIESGHLVTLTCHSEHGSPKPTYTWTRLDQTKTRRPVLGRSESTKTGILEIRNISQFEFGEYQCNATNVVGFSICTVDLSPGMFHFFLFVLEKVQNCFIHGYKNLCTGVWLCRGGRRSDCWSSDRRSARLCPHHPGGVVHRSHHEEAQIQGGESIRGQRDEVRPSPCRAPSCDLCFQGVTPTLSPSTRRSSPPAQGAADSVPVATAASNVHAEADEPQA
uniref:V-set and immunoglobulin domain-containing protein 1 n=1 Tax=Seriola lalandi dorsalis TaxID=1841481 RepID=A0A3B4XXB1_SERLL